MAQMTDAKTRIETLRELIVQGSVGTQEEICEALLKRKFNVNQSTISRDLRRIGAIKVNLPNGETVYKLPDESLNIPVPPSTGLRDLLIDIHSNDSMIVIHTTPGSASLVARHLDATKPEGLLGTLAGDDTIFVAPSHSRKIQKTVEAILAELGS